jgi:hypothetical protein
MGLWRLQVAVIAQFHALAVTWAAVEIGCATGPNAANVNGFYERTGEVKNGKPVFAKMVDAGSDWDVGLWESSDTKWCVSGREDIDANKAVGWAYTVHPGVIHPAVPGTAWQVQDGAELIMQPITVQAFTAAEAVRFCGLLVAWFSPRWLLWLLVRGVCRVVPVCSLVPLAHMSPELWCFPCFPCACASASASACACARASALYIFYFVYRFVFVPGSCLWLCVSCLSFVEFCWPMFALCFWLLYFLGGFNRRCRKVALCERNAMLQPNSFRLNLAVDVGANCDACRKWQRHWRQSWRKRSWLKSAAPPDFRPA